MHNRNFILKCLQHNIFNFWPLFVRYYDNDMFFVILNLIKDKPNPSRTAKIQSFAKCSLIDRHISHTNCIPNCFIVIFTLLWLRVGQLAMAPHTYTKTQERMVVWHTELGKSWDGSGWIENRWLGYEFMFSLSRQVFVETDRQFDMLYSDSEEDSSKHSELPFSEVVWAFWHRQLSHLSLVRWLSWPDRRS